MTAAFNRDNLKAIRADINTALRVVAERHGISFDVGNIRFQEGKFTTKVTATTKTYRDPATTSYASSGNIKIGSFFKFGGTEYCVTQLRLDTRSKYKVIARGPRGGEYRFTRQAVEAGLCA